MPQSSGADSKGVARLSSLWFKEVGGQGMGSSTGQTFSISSIQEQASLAALATTQCPLTAYASTFQRWKQRHFRYNCLSQLSQDFKKERNSFNIKVALNAHVCHYMTFRQPFFFFIISAMLGIMSKHEVVFLEYSKMWNCFINVIQFKLKN